jgi:hypothetical protein
LFCSDVFLSFIAQVLLFWQCFFTENMKNLLKDKFFQYHERSSPFYGNTRHIYCEHSTIEFNPRSEIINKYKQHYGHVQILTVLAYVEDEHASTILVHYVGSTVKPYTSGGTTGEVGGAQLPLDVLSLSSGRLLDTGFGESSPFFRKLFHFFQEKMIKNPIHITLYRPRRTSFNQMRSPLMKLSFP